jgi:hypothetical protein
VRDPRHTVGATVTIITSASNLSSLRECQWWFCSQRKETVTDITDIDTDRSKRGGLTSEAIFRVWKAAIKDDEKLLDELIASVHEQMISLDQARAERVMSLVIRRHCNAKEAFKAMLIGIRMRMYL